MGTIDQPPRPAPAQLFEALEPEIVNAGIHLRTAKRFSEALASPMQDGIAWFMFVSLDAHFCTALFCLIRLFDNTKRALSLYRLMQTCKAHLHELSPSVAERAETDLKALASELRQVAPLIARLREQRNKVVAHLDPASVLPKLRAALAAEHLKLSEAERLLIQATRVYASLYRSWTDCDLLLLEVIGEEEFDEAIKRLGREA